jgi:hypothetical protein
MAIWYIGIINYFISKITHENNQIDKTELAFDLLDTLAVGGFPSSPATIRNKKHNVKKSFMIQ